MDNLNEVIERGAEAICDTRNYPGRYDQLSRGNKLAQQKWLEAAKAFLATFSPGDRISEDLWVSDRSIKSDSAPGAPHD